MPERRVDHLVALAVASGQLGSHRGVPSFHLVVGRLADIVQQAATPANRARKPHLGGQHAGQVGHLERVPQHVL